MLKFHGNPFSLEALAKSGTLNGFGVVLGAFSGIAGSLGYRQIALFSGAASAFCGLMGVFLKNNMTTVVINHSPADNSDDETNGDTVS